MQFIHVCGTYSSRTQTTDQTGPYVAKDGGTVNECQDVIERFCAFPDSLEYTKFVVLLQPRHVGDDIVEVAGTYVDVVGMDGWLVDNKPHINCIATCIICP